MPVTDFTQLPQKQKMLTLAGTLLGMLLAALDQTIVSTAGPAIQNDLHIEPSLYVWLTTSYLVSSTVMTPVWGKLSDIYGRRTILVTGISIFLLGSLACGLSSTTQLLIAARVVQGLGAASLFTTAFAVVADLFTARERGKYSGIFGAVFGLSSVVGPLVGGFITDNISWHWCFYINLPIGAVALGVILTRMPPLKQEQDHKPKIDFIGALLFGVAVVPLLLALSFGKFDVKPNETGFLWTSPQILAMFAAFVVFLGAFIAWERRAPDAMIDLKLFGNKAFAIGNLASFVVGMSFLGAIVFLPLFMVNVVGLSATRSGLTTTPLTFGIVAANIISGQVSSRTGKYKFLIIGALLILMAGFAIMAFTVDVNATQAGMSLRMIIIGLGLGPAIPLFSLHISNAVEPRQIGAATSTSTLSRNLGSTIGIAIFGTFFGTTLTQAMTDRIAEATADVPPAFISQLRAPSTTSDQTPAGEEGTPAATAFDQKAIEQKIHDRFAAQRVVVDKAIGADDEAALAELAKTPNLDERMKAVVDGGGIAKVVGAGFAAQKQKLQEAFDKGPDAVAAVANDPTVSPGLAAKLKEIPPPALASPEARAQILAGISLGLDKARDDAIVGARAQALAGAKKGLDDAEAKAVATVGKIGAAMKQAFTDAIVRVYFVAIFFALFGLLVTLMLPELPLRGGPGGGAGRPPPSE